MENEHKGSEYKNIIETWEENEKKRGSLNSTGNATPDEEPKNDLERLIKEEATEYDNENKENRVLSGDRATINDEGADDED